jgi:hypothetical protein
VAYPSVLYISHIYATDYRSAIIIIIIIIITIIIIVVVGCRAISQVGPRSPFQFVNPVHSGMDSLDGGSAHGKVSVYTQVSYPCNRPWRPIGL